MRKHHRRRSNAFSLVEVVLAMAIMSFCVMILLGLLPMSMTTIKNASEETAGINVISNIIWDLRSTPATSNTSPAYQLVLPTDESNANQPQILYVSQAGTVLTNANIYGARYKVTITLGSPTLQNTINGEAQVSWPAMAKYPMASVETFFALNRN